jgi:hypothetical protein
MSSDEFMLKEYDRINGLILDEIRQSEQRVNFFLTIASSAAGVLILFSQSSLLSEEVKFATIEGALGILLLYGFVTLNRMNSRIVQLTTLKIFQKEIQKYFTKGNKEVSDYFKATKGAIDEHPLRKNKLTLGVGRWLRGALQDLMILTNSLICGGITLVALSNAQQSLQSIIIWTSISTILAIIVFYNYHYFMRTRLPPMP